MRNTNFIERTHFFDVGPGQLAPFAVRETQEKDLTVSDAIVHKCFHLRPYIITVNSAGGRVRNINMESGLERLRKNKVALP